MPPEATPLMVRHQVQQLMADAWAYRKSRMRPLHHMFCRAAFAHPLRRAFADSQGKAVNSFKALAGTLVLARRLRDAWRGQSMVGILLPPAVPAALVNFSAMFLGKTPVNLNYTLSQESLDSCVRQCELRTILTSRAFLEKLTLKVSVTPIYIEDIAANLGTFERTTAALAAALLPARFIERWLGNSRPCHLDDLATVIFSSGSTGDPKGVRLSHFNIGSNIAQLEQVFGLEKEDGVLGILPFFHSFGFTATLCLPAVCGVPVAYHVNPLDARTVGQLVQQHRLTFVLATPTFLQIYLRGCAPENFGSVRVVLTGAEKLLERVATAFEEKFGIRPLEGYGCTECSPAVAVSTPDYRAAGFHQVGSKKGKIGQPLPGMCVRIQDPNSGALLPEGAPGLLVVRGPNVMQGYLRNPEKTSQVLRDGWYATGDIAAMDEDGFLQITDRLSRFSKIGGEMVPHLKIEEKLHELAEAIEQSFVVTAVPDEKKGEKLVVLHRLTAEKLQPVFERLAACDLPNLWKPKPESFIPVEAFPTLGSGKLDLKKVRDLARNTAVTASNERETANLR